MCDLVSWIESVEKKGVKPAVMFLTDDDVFKTKRGTELQQYAKSNEDYSGHGSIIYYYDLVGGKYRQCECSDFRSPNNFPDKIVKAIKECKLIKISEGDDNAFENMKVMLLPQSYSKPIQYWNKLIDNMKFSHADNSPLQINEKEVKTALKRIFKNGEASAGTNNSEGHDMLSCFDWDDTDEGFEYWNTVDNYLDSDRNMPSSSNINNIEQFWKLFKNPKNRIKAWR
jgi:hypothetical protein